MAKPFIKIEDKQITYLDTQKGIKNFRLSAKMPKENNLGMME